MGLSEDVPIGLLLDDSQRYFVPSLSAGAFSSRIGVSSRICAPQTSPSALLAGIKIPAVRVPNRTVHLPSSAR